MNTQFGHWWFVFLITLIISACNQSPDTLFTKVSPRKSNITFKNSLLETDEFNVIKYTYFYNGGGVAIGDVNNDGNPDIYFTGNMVASHLYLNQGNFEFKNVAKEAGVEAAGLWNTGVSMADVNDDGWLDIYICRSAAASVNGRRNLLFINNGTDDTGIPTFTESAAEYGLDDPSYSTQATFFDYDRDGDLDMYLLNHSIPQYANFTADIEQLKKQKHPHFSDKLYENRDGKYYDVSTEAGLLNNVLGFGLGVAVADYNSDGWPDVYVSNDYHEEDYLYINQQDGTFREELRDRMDYTSLFSMGSDAGDINNDGRIDLLSLDMLPQDNYRIKLTSGADNYNKYQLLLERNFYKQNMRNMLQLNQGNGRFEEVGQLAGISNSDWSWSALMADYNLDGWTDLFVTNGYVRDFSNMDFLTYATHFKMENPELREQDIPVEQLIEHMPQIAVANKMYRNEASFRFSDVSDEWGFSDVELSNGAAYGDLDGDGDLDLVINNVNAPASLYQNHVRDWGNGHFLGVIPLESEESQPAIGSQVMIILDSSTLVQELYPARGFQSSVQPVLLFGLGKQTTVNSLVVTWPQGEREVFSVDSVDQYYTLIKGQGERAEADLNLLLNKEKIFIEDSIIHFTHLEDRFNDFDVEGLLPRYYSRSGPAMARGDLNGDGIVDILIGGGPGQPATMWYGRPDGSFVKQNTLPAFQQDAGYEDVAIAITDMDQDSDLDIFIASGGNQYPAGDAHYLMRYYQNNGKGQYLRDVEFPQVMRNATTLVAGDFDDDGHVDVFLGAGYKAQLYPYPGGNVIIWNKGNGSSSSSNGGWKVDENLPFSKFNCMDANWMDIDGDGAGELILGGEWQRVEIWGIAQEGWIQKGHSQEKGLITALKVVNLDDDPEKEIIVGNWGENSQLKASSDEPLVLYYGDFDNNGTVDPVLSYFVGGQSYPFVSRDDLTGQLPHLKKFFQSYHEYGEMTMSELLTHLPDYQADSAQILSSFILDYQKGQWVTVPLPREAQVAPVFAIETVDYDQDGLQDIILAGNSTYNRVKIGEIEANHGVLLKNRGGLHFDAVSAVESGLNLSGEVRSVETIKSKSGQYVLFGVNDDRVATYRLSELVTVQ